MQLRSGLVTLLRAEFQSPKFSPQSDLRRRAAIRWALPQFLFILIFIPPVVEIPEVKTQRSTVRFISNTVISAFYFSGVGKLSAGLSG